jgi:MFS family permease
MADSALMPAATRSSRRSSPIVVALASLVGTATEWYDFYIFGGSAALVFPRLFFPGTAQAGAIASFAVFWVAFIGRPFGAAFFGHFGDRIGRKSMLIVALMLMGSGTVAIGLLPPYAAIGIWAPVLLVVLRFIQGFAVGGEYGGAVLMATEHAPPKARGFFGSFPQLGSPIGMLLSSGSFAWVVAAYSSGGQLTPAFFAYGWRIPFIARAVLIAIGLAIRLSIAESPAFERIRADDAIVKFPLMVALRTQWKTMLFAAGIVITINTGYLWATQIVAYASGPQSRLHVPASEISLAVAISAAVSFLSILVAGRLSDRFGRRNIALLGVALILLTAFPFYWLIDTARFPLILLAECGVWGIWGVLTGPLAALFAEAFAGNVRYTAASVSYHGGAVIGGAAPVIATILCLASLKDRRDVDLAMQ